MSTLPLRPKKESSSLSNFPLPICNIIPLKYQFCENEEIAKSCTRSKKLKFTLPNFSVSLFSLLVPVHNETDSFINKLKNILFNISLCLRPIIE